MAVGMVLNLFQESPVLRVVLRSQAGHGDDFTDPPILPMHSRTAVSARRIPLASPSLNRTSAFVLHFHPSSGALVDPVDLFQDTGRGPFLIGVKFGGNGMVGEKRGSDHEKSDGSE